MKPEKYQEATAILRKIDQLNFLKNYMVATMNSAPLKITINTEIIGHCTHHPMIISTVSTSDVDSIEVEIKELVQVIDAMIEVWERAFEKL